jgi:hypothetical protein
MPLPQGLCLHREGDPQGISAALQWEVPEALHISNPASDATTGHPFCYEIFQMCQQDTRKKHVANTYVFITQFCQMFHSISHLLPILVLE